MRYRGAIGQWSWILHRLSGLGVVLFLILHVVDTSWAVFYPELYEHAIKTYQSPLFTAGEFVLIACVIFHAFNGLRIAIFDFKPELWRHQQRAIMIVLVATALVLVPVFIGMFGHVIGFYTSDRASTVLGLGDVIAGQLPFLLGFAVAIVAALALSGVYGLFTDKGEEVRHQPSQVERFWWSFMRVSALLIIPLVFMHLAAMHVIQGVFDINLRGAPIVGVVVDEASLGEVVPIEIDGRNYRGIYEDGSLIINGINDNGKAVEFVAERWNFMTASVALYRVIDLFLLILVTIHGMNGLRYVLTDYTMHNRFLQRASVYLCVIAAVVLLSTGGLALLSSAQMVSAEFVAQSILGLGG
ncbi:hypothetical protein MASR2M15_12670 [Anaerolineales bacterium]